MKFSGKQPKSFTRLVETVGLEATLALIVAFGGKSLHIPKVNNFLINRRNKKIFEDHSSKKYTQKQLMAKWDMPMSTIYTIARRYKAAMLEADKDE